MSDHSSIGAGDQITLAHLTKEDLIEKNPGLSKETALDILTDWDKEMEGVYIIIKYEDLFGKTQKLMKKKY